MDQYLLFTTPLVMFILFHIAYSLDNCVDHADAHCDTPRVKAMCKSHAYKRIMARLCRKSCNLCQPGTCMDVVSECKKPKNKALCTNRVYKRLMKSKCPQTCGECGKDGGDGGSGNGADGGSSRKEESKSSKTETSSRIEMLSLLNVLY
ncbi:unnamed protein product [Bursaphelenchus xylophilus]|uniref:(pine wood nematode) hypothetical protein n=1 Tax=Bursaphelenchus xylophilus TaxID=6326 RepID=A0A1I7RJ60_BURXY|nr:unnamed protein product [Bursaphelenchus xylophilus]CAG9119382.1 unnamed protein product [Bursaphelenchus xylophilus]